MAFVIDADPTSPTMNCYLTVEEADAYFEGNFTANAAWTALSDEQKPAALRQATLKLETLRYGGLKTTSTQPLQQPRANVSDYEGNLYPSDVVIPGVKYATCEMAYWIISEGDRLLDDTEFAQFKSYNVGPINVAKDTSYDDSLPVAVSEQLKSVGPGFVSTSSGKNYKYARM